MKNLKTLHGTIKYPTFMPDATYGTVKSMSWQDLNNTGTNALVTTTLHIEQKLGSEYIRDYGGLHKFFGWDRPILTDSGGFQVYSLIHSQKHRDNKISEAGCSFVDPRTGNYKFLSPETSQIIQHNLGSDIRVVLDEPTPIDASHATEVAAVERTTRWARRSKDKFLELIGISEQEFLDPSIERPLLCCVVQGGNNLELRRQSAAELAEIGFDIYGFGGAPLLKKITWKDDNRSEKFYAELLEATSGFLPDDKPKYALGVGKPSDIKTCYETGWQLFDTVLPTRNARHGQLYMPPGDGDKEYSDYSVMHIRSQRYKFDETPINSNSSIPELRKTSRAYLRHLIRIKDPAGFRIASLHNLEFYQCLITDLSQK